VTEPAAVRVLVVDDDALMRAGLRGVLSSDDAVVVVGEAGDGREAIERVAALEPDVVLMDVRMPGLDGIAATREVLAAAADDVRVLILMTFEQDDSSSARCAPARPASCSSTYGPRS
jgi:DNA-binding NarL/FixJ family response regulator